MYFHMAKTNDVECLLMCDNNYNNEVRYSLADYKWIGMFAQIYIMTRRGGIRLSLIHI